MLQADRIHPEDVIADEHGTPVSTISEVLLGAAISFLHMVEDRDRLTELLGRDESGLIAVLHGIERLEEGLH